MVRDPTAQRSAKATFGLLVSSDEHSVHLVTSAGIDSTGRRHEAHYDRSTTRAHLRVLLLSRCADAREGGGPRIGVDVENSRRRRQVVRPARADARAIAKSSRRWTTGRLAYNSIAHPVAIPGLRTLSKTWCTTRHSSNTNVRGGAVASQASAHLPGRSASAPRVRPALSVRRKRAMLGRLHVHTASRARNRGRRSTLWCFPFPFRSRLRDLPLSSLSLQFSTVSLHTGQHQGLRLFCPCERTRCGTWH